MSVNLVTGTDPWWSYARSCARALYRGEPAPAISVYGPVLEDGEVARVCTTAVSSRLIGGDGSYQRSSTFLMGGPALVIGMLAAQGLMNHRRRKQALRDTVAQWRHPQESTVVITNERIMCSGSEGTLVDFWFEYVTEFYPHLWARSVTLAFGERCYPLRLDGPAAPAIALWCAHALYGPAWVNDARFAPLVAAATERAVTHGFREPYRAQ